MVTTAADMASLASDYAIEALEPGVYLVGSGSTGAAETFLTLGTMYGTYTYHPPPYTHTHTYIHTHTQTTQSITIHSQFSNVGM